MKADSDDEVLEEVTARLARHSEALGTGNVGQALELYTDEAVVRPAHVEPVRGCSELREFYARFFEVMTMQDVSYRTERLDVPGDRAYQIGTYEGVLQPLEGEGTRDRGSFLIVWQRQGDGSWLHDQSVFSSSFPK